LGLPPAWYKSFAYRSRTVKEPRTVLAHFGVTLPPETEIRVWDSTAETRYLVVPMRPAETEGWSEAQLANLITRDCMIGAGLPKNAREVVGGTGSRFGGGWTVLAGWSPSPPSRSFIIAGKDACWR